MINFKQEELIYELFDTLKTEFPEITYLGITESPESSSSLWLNVTAPEDEDREIALIEFAGDKTTDILINYGYSICVVTRSSGSEFARKHASFDRHKESMLQPV